MRHILIFGLLFTTLTGCGCECAPPPRDRTQAWKSNYEYSDLVFVGQVKEVNEDGSYSFEVIETFKGETSSTLLSGEIFNTCSTGPDLVDALWIVYAETTDDGQLDISMCSLSRPFSESPFLMKPKLSSSGNSVMDLITGERQKILIDLESLTYLELELNWLEARKKNDGTQQK